MSNASTKKAASRDDDEIDLTSGRFRPRPGRGAHAHRRAELPLSGIRKATGKTQVEVAAAANMSQGEVSRLEGQDDMMLSTLKRYAEGLGLRVEVAFVFSNGVRVYLK